MDLFSVLFVCFFHMIVLCSQKSIADKDTSDDFANTLKHSIRFENITNIIEYLHNSKNITTLPVPRHLIEVINLLPMLKRFYEIETCNETGNPITKSDLNKDPVTDTDNYQIFRNLSINQHHLNFTKSHLGRYPVIFMNFSLPLLMNIISVPKGLRHCRDVIHKAYKQHLYLINSTKLNDNQKRLCRKWCDDIEYRSLILVDCKDIEYRNLTTAEFSESVMELENSLMNLARYLHKHFDREYVVLIDEYDTVFKKAIVSKNRDTFIQCSVLYTCILEAVFIGREESAPVAYGIMSGRSDIVIHSAKDPNIPALYEILRREHNILINRFYGFYDFK